MAEQQIFGFKELTRQLDNLGAAAGGSLLRKSARFAMKAAEAEAKASAPVGAPPYVYAGASYGGLRAFDPYPRKTYRGRLVAPGFTSRSVRLKTWLSRDKSQTNIMLGVLPEAFEALQFVERGTSRAPARPWLEPAFRRSLPVVNTRFKQALKRNLDKAARS